MIEFIASVMKSECFKKDLHTSVLMLIITPYRKLFQYIEEDLSVQLHESIEISDFCILFFLENPVRVLKSAPYIGGYRPGPLLPDMFLEFLDPPLKRYYGLLSLHDFLPERIDLFFVLLDKGENIPVPIKRIPLLEDFTRLFA